MAHQCIYCKRSIERIDTDDVVRISAERWAHKKCFDDFHEQRIKNLDKEEVDLEVLKSYINEIFKGITISWPLILKEVKNFRKDGMTLSGMYKTLIYMMEVKRVDRFKLNGHIKLIETYYKQAEDYYKKIYVKNKKLSAVKLEDIQIKISSPRPRRNYRLIDIEGELEKNDEKQNR